MIDIDCLGFVQFNLFKKGIVKDGYFLGLGQFNLFKKGVIKDGDFFDVRTHEWKHRSKLKT
jgi:hypothetical protein